MNIPKVVSFFSGGIGSWAATKRYVADHGADGLVLFFSDTKTEDEDLYRFLYEAAANVGGELIVSADGRDIWQVFHDKHYLGNWLVDPCSRILKRDRGDAFLKQHCDPTVTTLVMGIDWFEMGRIKGIQNGWAGWRVEFPLCGRPMLTKKQQLDWLRSEGIKPPRLYDLGFPHNNCGGFCVKAGQAHFKHLLKMLPERYRYHEEKEKELRAFLGKDVAIIRKQTNKVKSGITMEDFRLQQEQSSELTCENDEWGGCSCFSQ